MRVLYEHHILLMEGKLSKIHFEVLKKIVSRFAHGVRGPHTWFYMLPDTIRLEGLCVALTIKHVQNDLVIVDNFASLASNEPRYLLDIAETRNWGYSVLFVNNSADVRHNFAYLNSLECSFIIDLLLFMYV